MSRVSSPKRLAFIPGFVHSYLAGWLGETLGEVRAARAMGWSVARLREVVAGGVVLRTDERDRLIAVLGQTAERVLDGEELWRDE